MWSVAHWASQKRPGSGGTAHTFGMPFLTDRAHPSTRLRVAVVGAGIVGASIAYHLARRGAAVTLLDAGHPAGGVTGAAFGWVNGAHGAFGAAAPLRQLAAEDWRRVTHDLGGALDVRWCGALSWQASPAETERFVRDRVAEGHDVRLVGRAALAALEPGLLDPPPSPLLEPCRPARFDAPRPLGGA